MDSKDISLPIKKNLVSKGNPWLISLKAVLICFLFWLYVRNLQQIAQYFRISNFFIAAIFLLVVPSIILYYLLRNKLAASLWIFTAHNKENWTVFILLNYIFYSLHPNFKYLSQELLIGIASLFLLYVWKNEILNKIRKKS